MCFCSHAVSFVELEPFRGTKINGARKLSPVTKLVRALEQYRGTMYIGARDLSLCRS